MTHGAWGLVWALSAMIGWGVGNAITRTPAIKIGAITTLFYRNVSVFFFLLPLNVYFWERTTIDFKSVLLTIGLSVLGYISLLMLFKAQKTGKLGIVNPVSGTSVFVSILLAVIMYAESITTEQMVSVILIFLGVTMTSFSIQDFRSSSIFNLDSGVFYALVTALCWGVMFAFLVLPVKVMGPFFTASVMALSNTCMSLMHLKAQKTAVLIHPDRKTLAVLMCAAMGSTIGLLGFNLAVTHISLSYTAAICAAAPGVGALIGVFVYKERHSFQHAIGIFITVSGVVALSYFR